MLGEPFVCVGGNTYPGAAGNVIQDHRNVDPVRNVCKMLIQTALRGLVVVRSDHQYTVGAEMLGALCFFQSRLRIVAADSGNDLHASVVVLAGKINKLLVLVSAHRCVFTRGAAHYERIRSVIVLKVHQFAETLKVDTALAKRCDDGGA